VRKVLIALTLALACKGATTAKDIADAAHPAGVWVASLRMVVQKRLTNSVPRAFARDAVESAIGEIDKCRQSVAQAHDAPKDIQSEALQAIADANKAAEGLKDALEKNDRGAIAAQDGELAKVQQKFERLKQ
jgi:hypothetical protein